MTKLLIDREERYTVIKHKDLTADDRAELDQYIQARHIPTRKCLVIEADWPEYEPAWRMIEARVTGASTKPATVQGDGWIHVNDATPNTAQEVIVFSEFDGVTAGFLDSYDEWYCPNSNYKLTRVSHWMPLPAAPAIAAARKGEVV